MGARHRAAPRCVATCAWRSSARRLADARSVMVEGVSGLLAVHPPACEAALRAVEAADHLAERSDRADFLGGRSSVLARPAILRRLVRRAVQMAPPGRDLGHAAIRPALRGEPAPGRDHHAAADEIAQGADRRSAHSGDACVDVGQRSQSRAWLSRCDRRALSRHAARAPGARCRAARGPSRRALAARSDRAGTRTHRAGDQARGGGSRPAGV